jgi:hypothetical protein
MLTVTITARTKNLLAQTYLVVRDQKSDRAVRFESEIFATSRLSRLRGLNLCLFSGMPHADCAYPGARERFGAAI